MLDKNCIITVKVLFLLYLLEMHIVSYVNKEVAGEIFHYEYKLNTLSKIF